MWNCAAFKEPSSCATELSELSNSVIKYTKVKPSFIVDVAIGWSKIYLLTNDGELSISQSCALTDVKHRDSDVVSFCLFFVSFYTM